ncbi:hypothetical protein ACFQ0D_31035, partial [Micromonospora zhanjiangensis]
MDTESTRTGPDGTARTGSVVGPLLLAAAFLLATLVGVGVLRTVGAPGPMGANSHTNYALRKNGLQEITPI